MNSDDPKIAKVQARFQELSSLASSLNTASDELTQIVNGLDEALKRLNIGLTVWVAFRFRGDDEEPQMYDQDQVGYAKVSGTWGIAVRRIWGDDSRDIFHEDGPWLFKDAPRELRIECLDQFPNVIEELAKVATATTKRVQEKTNQIRNLASAIGQAGVKPVVVGPLRDSPHMKLSELGKGGK
jgi:hypothetical protein